MNNKMQQANDTFKMVSGWSTPIRVIRYEEGKVNIPHTQIPNDIVRDRRFTSHEKSIYLVLRSHAGNENWCWLTMDTLREESGITNNAGMYEALAALYDSGLVVRFEHKGKASTCWIVTNLVKTGWIHPPSVPRHTNTDERKRKLAEFNAKKKEARRINRERKENDISTSITSDSELKNDDISTSITSDFYFHNDDVSTSVNEEEPVEEEPKKNLCEKINFSRDDLDEFKSRKYAFEWAYDE